MPRLTFAVEVPATYYKYEQKIPVPYPAAEWRSHYQSEKKKPSESWLQQLHWCTRIAGSEAGPKRMRKLHPSEVARIKTNSPWAYWDSILQITGLRPGIDLKKVIIHLSRCQMMEYPASCTIYNACKRRLSRALQSMCAVSWADNFDGVLTLPDQTELETIRILGESNQETPRLGYFPRGIYQDLKALGLAGMIADDQTNETALLCWRASLRAVGAKMGYHSLDKLKEETNRLLPMRNETVIDLDDYCQQQDERRGRLDALVADDRDQSKPKPMLEKNHTGKMKMKLEKSDTDTVEVELEKRDTNSMEMELKKTDTIPQSVEAIDDERKESTGLQHGKNTGDRGQQPSQAGDSDYQQHDKISRDHGQQPPNCGDWGRQHTDIELELGLSDSSSSECSDSEDLVKRQDDILKYQESRIRRLESIIKKRKAKALHKSAERRALTKRLQQKIKELTEKNSALEEALGNRRA